MNNNKLLQSLIDYVEDVKPYHTKIKGFTSELLIEDKLQIKMKDSSKIDVYQQNVWGAEHLGGDDLYLISEGIDSDRFFTLPDTIFPRFSLSDSLNFDQTPVGDDPAGSLVDTDDDGIPDANDPYSGSFSRSHQTGSDQVAVDAKILSQTTTITGLPTESSGTYSFTYDLRVKIDSTEQELYGFGNPTFLKVDGVDKSGVYQIMASRLALPAITNNYISTPDNATVSVTGDIDIRMKLSLVDWIPPVDNQGLARQWLGTTSQRGWDLRITASTGVIRFAFTQDGTTQIAANSTVAVPFIDGEIGYIRVNRVASTGVVTFYTSLDGLTWTQLGTTVATTAGNMWNSDQPLIVGMSGSGGDFMMLGSVYRFELRTGPGAALVAYLDPERDGLVGASSLVSSLTGETWTLTTSGGNPAVLATTPGSYVIRVQNISDTFVPEAGDEVNFSDPVTTYAVSEFGLMKNQPAVSIGWTNTGRFSVPFHQGSRVRLDGVNQVLGTDYFVDRTRNFIQFASGSHPTSLQKIDINLMTVDRLFIAYNLPFDWNVSRGWGAYGYDMVPYDGGATPELNKADRFEIQIINATGIVSSNYDGVGNGTFTLVRQRGSVAEDWTLTAISATTFTVVGSFSGSQQNATVGIPYNNGIVSFLISDGSTDFLAGDEYTFSTANLSDRYLQSFFNAVPNSTKLPLTMLEINEGVSNGDIFQVTAIGYWKFKVQRTYPTLSSVSYAYFKTEYSNGIKFIIDRKWSDYLYVADVGSYSDVIGTVVSLDPTDYLVNLDLKTQHGVPVDPVPTDHFPMEMTPWGVLRQLTDGSYQFELDEVPIKGTYIEFRVEQNNQYTGWMGVSMQEFFNLQVIDVLAPIFEAPLLGSAYFDGAGQLSFTRTTAGTGVDYDNKMYTSLPGEIRFEGFRRVQNLLTGSSEDLTNDAWTRIGGNSGATPWVTIENTTNPWGQVAPVSRVRFNLNGGTLSTDLSDIRQTLASGSNLQASVYLKSATGATYTVQIRVGTLGSNVTVTVTDQWKRFAIRDVSGAGLGLAIRLIGSFGTSNFADIYVAGALLEDTSAQVITAPGDHVSVGVVPQGIEYYKSTGNFTNYVGTHQIHNLLAHSEQVDQWGLTSAPTINVDQYADPLGQMTIDTIVDDSAAAYEGVFKTITIPNDTSTYQFAALVRKDLAATYRSGINLAMTGGGTPISRNMRFALDGTNANTCKVHDYDANFWLVTDSVANNGTGNTSLSVSLFGAVSTTKGGIDEVAAVGSTSYGWIRLQRSNLLQPYIKTLSTAITNNGDQDLRFELQTDNWSPASVTIIAARWNTTTPQRAWVLSLNAGTGTFSYRWSPDGTNTVPINSIAHGLTNQKKHVRVTHDIDNGSGSNVVTFYLSDDGITWTPLGASIVTAGVTSYFDSTALITLGQTQTGISDLGGNVPWNGKIYSAELRNGIGGTVTAKFDPVGYRWGGSIFTSPTTGNRWSSVQGVGLAASRFYRDDFYAYHGAGVDGVKYFTRQNGNTVAVSGEVTEAQGIQITDNLMQGYRVERATTNFILNSDDLSAATYANIGAGGVVTNVGIGPFGNLVLDQLQDASAVSMLGRSQTVAVANDSTVWTLSAFFLKTSSQVNRAGMQLRFIGGTELTYGITINTNNGTLTDRTAGTPIVNGTITAPIAKFVEDYSPTLWRVQLIGQNNTSGNTTLTCDFVPAVVDSADSGTWVSASTGNTTCGAIQLENRFGASTYLATAAASVTRNDDLLYYPSTGNVDPSQGAVTGEMQTDFTPQSLIHFPELVSIDDATVNNRIIVYGFNNAGNGQFYLGSTKAGLNVSSRAIASGVTLTARNKIAAAWKADAYKGTVNGAAVTTDYAAETPSSVSRIAVGYHVSGNVFTQGAVRNLKIYSQHPSDQFLRNVSTISDAVADALSLHVNFTDLGSGVANIVPTVGSGLATFSRATTASTFAAVPDAYVTLPGTAGSYVSTPDSAAVSVINDLDLRVKLAADDWTPAAAGRIISKWRASKSYLLFLNIDGSLTLYCSTNGTDEIPVSSAAAIPSVINGQAKHIRVTRAYVSGEVKFYASDDGITWTQFGSTPVLSAGSPIFNSSDPLELGSDVDAQYFAGKIYSAKVLNGINGSTVASFDASDGVNSAASITSSATGEVWTINGGACVYLYAITTVASGAPRGRYDPTTLAYRGYFAEGQRQNMALWSTDLTQADWVKTDITFGSNGVAPDGSSTANLVISGATGVIQQVMPFAAGLTITVSKFFKKAATSAPQWICLTSSSTGGLVRAWFDLTNGVIGSNTPTSGTQTYQNHKIEAYPNGWYRCSLTTTMATDVALTMAYFPTTADNVTTRQVGAQFYAWGGQGESSAQMSSTIFTQGSAVTKNLDLLTFPASSNINFFEGTIFTRASQKNPSGNTQRIVSLNDGSVNDSYQVAFNSSFTNTQMYVEIRDDGALQMSTLVGSTAGLGVEVKYALAYQLNNCAASSNASAVTTDTSVALPNINTINVGTHAGGASPMWGCLNELRIYKKRLTDSQLQALTTP